MGIEIAAKLAIGIKYNFTYVSRKTEQIRFNEYTGEKITQLFDEYDYLFEDKSYDDIFKVISLIEEKTKLNLFNIHASGLDDNFWYIGLLLNSLDVKREDKCFQLEEKDIRSKFEETKKLLENAGFSDFDLKLFDFVNYN